MANTGDGKLYFGTGDGWQLIDSVPDAGDWRVFDVAKDDTLRGAWDELSFEKTPRHLDGLERFTKRLYRSVWQCGIARQMVEVLGRN